MHVWQWMSHACARGSRRGVARAPEEVALAIDPNWYG
jgi:hypothetical protein